MAIDFKLPELGENIESGDVVSVLVKEGDQISVNQGVVELETDKAVVEVPSPYAGRVTKVHVQKRQKVPIGGLLISIEAEQPAGGAKQPAKPAAEAKQPPAEPKKPAAEAQAPTEAQAPAPTRAPARAEQPATRPAPATTAKAAAPSVSRQSNGGAPPAAPSTRRFARELGVNLGSVAGSGPGGRITREDVMQAVRESNAGGTAVALQRPSAPAEAAGGDRDSWGAVKKEPLTKIRKTIAANMARSHTTIPHVTNFDDADITELERIRKGSMSDYVDKNVKLTMMSFVMKAVAHALKLHPAVNATLDLDNEQVIYKQYVNLGVAVDTERGLVVPVMRAVDRMTIPQIAQGLTDMATKARGNQFSLDDLRGGTFTISNLGAVGGIYSTPIINYPEVAILLVGRSRKLPVVVGDEIKPRLMMPLSLSYDHRWIDGATAARFLNEVINFLQVPGRLLLAP
jgi:pyruvate dehydrogenase E2 component (dihydrolipoamide acetyltransferase)